MPETTQPATTTNNKSQLGAFYLNSHIQQVIPNSNISMHSSDSFAQENLKTLLNEKLNDKIFTTFKATFSNINLGSVSEITPKGHEYNNEIAKFIQNIKIKYGILLEFNVLEIPEVSHWAEMFQVRMNSIVQQETQSSPVPATNFSVPPLQVNISLNHQQAEIDRLIQVMQQWSTEGPHQYHHTQANYNADPPAHLTCHQSIT